MTLGVCVSVSVRLAATARRISLGGEGNALNQCSLVNLLHLILGHEVVILAGSYQTAYTQYGVGKQAIYTWLAGWRCIVLYE